MVYFKRFPKSDYTFRYTNSDGEEKTKTIDIVDIFRKVTFTKESKTNTNNFEYHVLIPGQKPEDIAREVYNDPNMWWVVLLFNDIVDPFNEWLYTDREMNDKLDDFYQGYSYFFMEQPAALPGDVLIKRDPDAEGGIDIDNFGYIDEYDPLLHKIDVKKIKGTISESDEVQLFRKNDLTGNYDMVSGFGATGCYPSFAGNTYCNEIPAPLSEEDDDPWQAPYCATAGSSFGIVQKRTTILDSVKEFSTVGDPTNPVSPYSGITGIAAGTNEPSGDFYTIGNICGLTSCILYRYIRNNLPSTVNATSRKTVFINNNDKKRTIKLIKPILVSKIQSEIAELFSGNVPRGTAKYIEVIG